MLVLSQADVRSLLRADELVDRLEPAFRELSAGAASVPPRVFASTTHGLLGAMPGWLPAAGLGAKLVAVFPKNHERGLPSHQALIALLDDETGTPLAVMDGTWITAVRTAAASAVAVRMLARPDARVLTIVGAGVQGASHLDAVAGVRGFDAVRVTSRSFAHARDLAATRPGVTAVEDREHAVRGADVVCLCTDASEPVIRRAWLAAGTHVGSVSVGAEVDEATIEEGRVFVEWRGAVVNPPPIGATELQGRDPDWVTELGEVLAGARPGRTSAQEITVYKSTGHAVEDVVAARLVYDRAVASGVGRTLDL
jgi:ornithine cyclodeaminase/alanine dehydrogenase-like protein (mu-crystallin family)